MKDNKDNDIQVHEWMKSKDSSDKWVPQSGKKVVLIEPDKPWYVFLNRHSKTPTKLIKKKPITKAIEKPFVVNMTQTTSHKKNNVINTKPSRDVLLQHNIRRRRINWLLFIIFLLIMIYYSRTTSGKK